MVINDLLQSENIGFINSIVVTVAPTYFGKGGVGISPIPKHDHTGRPQPVLRFGEPRWLPMGEDAVVCGKVPTISPSAQGQNGNPQMLMRPVEQFSS